MKILLFGGTFDPPHAGHMNNLRAAIELVRPDRAIVMPAGIPPHKQASATPGSVRLAMCACFRAVDPCVEISGWEIERGGRSYTYHTLTMLAERWPAAERYMTVGSDMLETFQRWYRWQDLLRLATLVVQSREQDDADALRAAARPLVEAGGQVLFTRAPVVECASSDIRAGRYTPEQLARLLPPPVPRLMEQYRLYRRTF
ncbi:MAG: nicotinate (nicotinamide) nucleotide adenylyltransferase [Gemmiger sp.]|uniref:nicotinate (nicotinamide) nucleotide adenylyltransferase n=1 Tax=Gemmiger sp. TaxID=2049027 RepID=UPI002E791198|nr:nicotinate (nicotinamide) nucleotide adenylyltransferase [Gemmiger sp.]MEE0801244.1 nicotinate (nicotinamide) nucleotide adenylyltransferase [Gemmiger sp.]